MHVYLFIYHFNSWLPGSADGFPNANYCAICRYHEITLKLLLIPNTETNVM